jgi:carbon storage regulator
MLVLSRKADESIVIDERITITILEIRGNKIRLGIEAPKEISIVREELIDTGMLTMIAV